MIINYYKTFLTALLIFICSISGCEKDSLLHKCCGVDNPVENLTWLKEFIESTSTNDSSGLTAIDLHEYESNEILVAYVSLFGTFDIPTGIIFDCTGEILYHCGGNQPVDSCSYVIQNSVLIGRIWEKK